MDRRTNQVNREFRRTHLFIYDKDLSFLKKLGEQIEMAKGRTLLAPNTTPKWVYWVVEGRVIKCGVTVLGEEVIYDSFGEGSMIFELEAPLHRRLKTTFRTATPCTLIRIAPDALLREISENNSSLMLFLEYLDSVRLHSHRQMRESSVQRVDWQVCKVLLTFSEQYGEPYDGKVMIREKISQETIARMLNISRNSVVRAFKALRDERLLERIDGYLVIRDIDALIQYMNKMDNLTF